jgi:hypothetical protein
MKRDLRRAAWPLGLAFALVSLGADGAGLRPFDGFAGGWSGPGIIRAGSGASESIRCRATYVVAQGGQRLHQDLVCAGDSFKFQIKSNVVQDGQSLNGVWEETTRSISGRLSGTVDGNRIEAQVDGGGLFSASLTLATSNNRQSVAIRPHGTGISEVTVNLVRSRG